MMRHGLVPFLFLLLIGGVAKGQENFIVKKNLKSEWLVHEIKDYTAYNQSKGPVNTIYFSIKPSDYVGDYLAMESDRHFSVLINGKLILDQKNRALISLDSLKKIFPESPFFFAVHQEQQIDPSGLETSINTKVKVVSNTEGERLRRETAF